MEDNPDDPALLKHHKSPYREKQIDYIRQRRTSSGGQAWRKVRTRLPRRERKLQRLAQDKPTRAALRDEDAALAAGDDVRSLKRSHFKELRRRREITLLEAVHYDGKQRWTEVGRRKGRGRWDTERSRKVSLKEYNASDDMDP